MRSLTIITILISFFVSAVAPLGVSFEYESGVNSTSVSLISVHDSVVHAQNTVTYYDNTGAQQTFDAFTLCNDQDSIGMGVLCALGMFFFYSFLYNITYVVAELGSVAADVSLMFSTQSQVYRFNDIMDQGWELVRNLVNIGFVAALLWVGILFLVGKG